MFLTAQRVVCLKDGAQGINSFCYVHEKALPKAIEKALDEPPGILNKTKIMIPPPGNRIRSFLDMVGPDHWEGDLKTNFEEFLRLAQAMDVFPKIVVAGNWAFKMDCDDLLATVWDREAQVLFSSLQALIHN